MKSFDAWVSDLSSEMKSQEGVPEELHGYEDPEAEGGYSYPCRRCGDLTDIICDPEEFDLNDHYCGKDQYCTP